MAFCEFSSEVISSSSTAVDNLFLAELMPTLDGSYVKVYLYGLYKCSTSKDNTLESFAKNLQMSEDDIVSVFYYLQELGLVNVINVEPLMVRYLPVRNILHKMKKYNVDKYTAFNISAQELMGSKMLTPRELEEFYYLIENIKMEKEAVLKIINYCVGYKGSGASVNYITAVAKNWAYDGVRTSQDVDGRLEEQERVSGDIVLVLKALGIKRQATTDEYQMYLAWTKDMDMSLDVIVHIAKKVKAKTFVKLSDWVKRCYSNRLFSIKEIDEYISSIDDMFALAKVVVKNLGLWYDNLETVVDNYISQWLSLGFEKQAIEKLSNYAFRSNIRTLENFNNTMQGMFKNGILTSGSVDNYMEDIVKMDTHIANILHMLGIERGVISSDRMMYKVWLYEWGITSELLDYAVGLARGKYSAMQYLNRVLGEYHVSSVDSVEKAKKHKLTFEIKDAKSGNNTNRSAKKRDYSKKELDSLFDDIQEVEI